MPSSVRNWNPVKQMNESRKSSPNSHIHRSDSEPKISLYVSGIPPELTENKLKNLFATYSGVRSVRIVASKCDKLGNCIGFVDYISKKEAENAIRNFNGYRLGKHTLKVDFAHQKKTHDNSYSELLQKLENGPLMEGDLKKLMQKSEVEVSQRPCPSSRAVSNGDFNANRDRLKMQSENLKQSPPRTQQRQQLKSNVSHESFHHNSTERTNNSFGRNKSFDPPKKSVGKFNGEDRDANDVRQSKTQFESNSSASEDNQRAIDRNKTLIKRNRRPFEKHQKVFSQNKTSPVNNDQSLDKGQVFEKQEDQSNTSSPNQNDKEKKGKPCHVCQTITNKICGSCSVTRYCSLPCQTKDWQIHKRICKQLKEDSMDTDDPLVVVEEALCKDLSRLLENTLSTRQKNADVNQKNEVKQKITPKLTITTFSSQVKVGKELDVLITEVNSELGTISFQIHNHTNDSSLKKNQFALNTSLTTEKHSLASPAVGDACACLFSEDDQWYRAVVKQLNTDETALIQYVDYGNSEVVKLNKLMQLDASFCQDPAFCVQCKLSGYNVTTGWSENQIQCLGTFLQQSGGILTANITEICVDFVYAHLKFGNVSVNEKMQELATAKPPERKLSTASSKSSLSIEMKEHLKDELKSSSLSSSISKPAVSGEKFVLNCAAIPEGKFDVIVSFVESPDHFYCQILCDDLVALHQALEKLEEYIVSNKKPFKPVVGNFCCAVYAEDGKWCRGKVIDAVTSELFLIQYIDYGNKAQVPLDQIQALPQEFCLPIQTFHSSLADCFPLPCQSWSEEAVAILKNFENNSCIVEMKQMRESRVDLSMYASEQDVSVNRLLISSGLAVGEMKSVSDEKEVSTDLNSCLSSAQPTMKQTLQISITSVDCNSLFYCQLIHDDLLALAELVENLTSFCDANQSNVLNPVSGGMYCAAFYASEGTWNRAVVLSAKDGKVVENEKVQVRFVDYGNCELLSVNKIQPLPKEYTYLPIQALCCSLADIRPIPGPEWSEEANIELKSCMELIPIEAQFLSEKEGQYVVKIPVLVNKLIKKEVAEYGF